MPARAGDCRWPRPPCTVRTTGKIYETLTALLQRRLRRSLYHSALVATTERQTMIEMAAVLDARGPQERGVVAEGAVGSRCLRRFRVFRYEIRRWPDGLILDLPYAIGGPVRVTDEPDTGASDRGPRPICPDTVLAETSEVTPGWRRLAWRAGGVRLIAREALMRRQVGRALLFVLAAGSVIRCAWPGSSPDFVASVDWGDLVTLLMVVAVVATARWAFGPPFDSRTAKSLRVGGYASILILIPAKNVIEQVLDASPAAALTCVCIS